MHRKIILSILAVAALFGLNVSGCNRNRTQTVANRQTRRDSSRTVRPAEVLSASAYRPPQHVYARTIPAPAPAYSEPAMAYRQQERYPPHQQYAQPQQVAYRPQPQPVYRQPQPAYVQPAVMAPQMAMARGSISPAPAPWPTRSSPQIQPLQYMPPASVSHAPMMYAHAPLPELEPMRPYRLPTPRDSTRPVAEIMVSEGTAAPRHDAPSADRQEIQRALAPLSPAPIAYGAGDSWVASPTTAMYQVPGRW